MTTLQYLGISVLFIIDLLGAVNAEVNTLTGREGQSVTLHPGLTGLQADKIFWFFGPVIPNTSIVESQLIRGENITEFKGRFREKLQLDRETGSLTIRNLTLNNSGVYQLDIFNTHKTSQRFYLTVYAPVPLPQVKKIPEGDFLDSSSEKGSCSVVCSVENRRDMTLSWYRGEKRLNQTSSPDLSTNLSLPLEIKLQDNNIYSCVAANPVSNQTTKLNIETLCLQFVDPNRITIVVIVLGIGLMLFIVICCIWKRKYIKGCCVSTSGSPEEEDSVVGREETHEVPVIENYKMTTLQYLGISVLFIIDLLGAVNAEVNTLTGREGQSVTLHPGLTGLQADKIFWFFGPVIPNTSIVESQLIRGENITEFKGRFREKLQLDRETGSLTIRNLTLNNSGVYQLDIFNTHKTSQRFYLTVYAPVPLPQVKKIPEGDFLDSSSEKGSCSVVCSVENRRDMTLSWYRGEKRLNQTSSPDLSTNLSLPLEIKLQDNNIYSCVAANPVSNQTTKLNIETLCLQFGESDPNLITIVVIVLGIGLMLFIVICCIWKRKYIKGCCVSTSGSPEEEDSVV
ncbi:uncharacterized protein LOC112231748 [Oncorhynchus tshawytscha]|uniref:uncharacterized protein LOC112231748 n=1 Tax=Oncorhynchus tshawytscha TaxID=74940 RepID=UPI001C3C6900|nr:uncharacterized protein LOC112231748 [Oncorhynchus tshawytscha]